MTDAIEQTPGIGHNSPPDPIEQALAPYDDTLSEAQNWLDGEPVASEDQMKAVDALLKTVKAAKKDVEVARDAETKPLHEAWQQAVARWKPTIEDLDRIAKGLAAATNDYRNKLAAEKEAAKRKAYEEAEAKRRAAEEAQRAANEADIEAQREAARLKQEAQDAKVAASAANKDKVKGLRTVHHHEVQDYKAALYWIAANDREAITAFIDAYAAKHFRECDIDGVKRWQTKESF